VIDTEKILLNKGELLPLMEEFYSIQGEGFHTGKASYFIRIGGCDVGCHWCDVKESWNEKLHPATKTDLIVNNALKFAKTVIITDETKYVHSSPRFAEFNNRQPRLSALETT